MNGVGDAVGCIANRCHDTHDHDCTVVLRLWSACHSWSVIGVIRSPLLWLLVVYYAVSAVTLVVWGARGVYSATGDEPHYLVIADALWTDGTTDVTAAYEREIAQPRWYPLGLAEPGSPLEPPAAHVVPTVDGFHSWHGVGVGALVALPAQLLGVEGARWAIVVIASLGVVLAWLIAGQFLPSTRARVGATAAVALAYPLLLAGTQIYPDVPAGVLLLSVLTWWVVPRARASLPWTVVAGACAALVPWLGSRFILPGVIAVAALLLANIRRRESLLAVCIPAAASAVGLLAYHLGAFGNLLGPPTEGVVAFGREFLLLLPGMVLDQNQGFLWANPVLWTALPGLVLLLRRNRPLAVLWLLLALSLWIPAAAHPGLYGLGSFNGRYSWPLALLAVLPALVALGALASRGARWFWGLVCAGLMFQTYIVVLSVVVGGTAPGSPAGLDLYTRPAGTWLESYSAWWFPLQDLLPAWYDPQWAFTYSQNWVWLLVAVLLVLGALMAWRIRGGVLIAALGTAAVVLAAVVSQPGTRVLEQPSGAVVLAGRDPVGYPVVGPAQLMRSGTYTWWVEYSTPAEGLAGKWELVRAVDDVVVASGELEGTSGAMVTEEIPVPFRSLQPREFLLRVGWYGDQDMSVLTTGVRYS